VVSLRAVFHHRTKALRYLPSLTSINVTVRNVTICNVSTFRKKHLALQQPHWKYRCIPIVEQEKIVTSKKETSRTEAIPRRRQPKRPKGTPVSTKVINIRVPADLVDAIDELSRSADIPISRSMWVIQQCYEGIARAGKKLKRGKGD
jgi:hypothetical protein